MDMTKLIENLEAYVQSFRNMLDKNDGSGLAALSANAKMALTNIRASVLDNNTARSALDTVAEYADKLEEAVKKGDRQLSANALILMEEAVQELRKRQEEKQQNKEGQTPCNCK